MSDSSRMRDLWPSRTQGLPPGQGAIPVFPRFSDKPLRWAPPLTAIDLVISVEGVIKATLNDSDLAAFDQIDQVSDFHCVTTWSRQGLHWSGVRLTDVIEATAGADLLPFAVASAADGHCSTYLSDDLLRPDVLLATRLDNAPLTRAHGAPLRIVSPSQYGYKSPKHLVAIDFCQGSPASTLGAKEHPRARVAHEERHANRPSWMIRLPYRLSILPTAKAAERGLRNSPD